LAKIYNKAIQDRIPEIIIANGEECIVRRLTDAEFLSVLEKKLHEELAGILEIVYKISELRGIFRERIETIRTKKAEEKGRFEENLFLIRIYSKSN
jgi:predicted house-cleaning noncanonical NTP pyrophosphatase (MazG superfamily)